ncbi:inter-alpha-trypsin inhibitor heavy chain H3-like isoform X2 [Cynoglossus semilaevis]|uniref:inter-alpha-trypsin inhibitor heavy chain H3-like isoform X2 n=1 Tax=Cynoglossus semilaevis TaxID=244447 RepID=UPI0007DCAAFE|nr:inter-alpha-trypsin inhibitor heavy chain H3-like isoform X2 [Cynoglossus semilaevis]
MLGKRLLSSTADMTAVRTVLILWLCVFICLPAETSGALVISRSDVLTQEDGPTSDIKSVKKRSTDSADMVEVQSVKIACAVMSRFARTVMTSIALNKANSSQEVFFKVELPKTAFISNFSMEIEGQVYVGQVKGKEKAKQEYDKAVSSGKTAGLVKASGRKMESFSVSVNIAAKSTVTFVLTYEELLQRKLGKYEILTRVQPKSLVQDFQIVADIYEPQGISFVDATATFLSNDLLPLVKKTVSDKKAHISFSPTVEQQRNCSGCEATIIDGDFIINYDVRREAGLGEVQIVNGYFVHFFAPPDLHRVPKNVAFVIDRSGSMSGTKMKQTRDAMVAILKDLHEEDHFALILFDDNIKTWKNHLTKATKNNITEAIEYTQGIRDSGATDINRAVLKAVEMLKKERSQDKVPKRSTDMIVLLTDGMPNSGVSNLGKIQENVRSAVGGNMSLFCLGFGNNVDYSFLDVMSKQNKGLARRIYEASDATLQLQGFYEEVASPLLLDIDLRYPDNAVEFSTKNSFTHLFNGSEIVVAGRLHDNSVDNFLVEVSGEGSEKNYQVQGKPGVPKWDVTYPEDEYIFGDFTERLWAYLTIQQLLDKSDVGSKGQQDVANAKALNMSLRYSFVTPLTSLVVTKPEAEAGTNKTLLANKLTESERQKEEKNPRMTNANTVPDQLSLASSPNHFRSGIRGHGQGGGGVAAKRRVGGIRRGGGGGGGRGGGGGGGVDGDPHFLIEVPDRDDALCFTITDKPGTIFSLVRDPKSGFVVNGQIIGVKGRNNNTYFGRLGISHPELGVRLEVSTDNISVFHDGKNVTLLWSDTELIKEANSPSLDLRLTENSLNVTLRHFIKFVIVKHTKMWKRRHDQQDYLGFYTVDSHHVSKTVHGLLGQFYHEVKFEVEGLNPQEVQEKEDAFLHFKGQTIKVSRHIQKDFSKDVVNGEKVPCWFVDSSGSGLVDGQLSDYVLSGLFD